MILKIIASIIGAMIAIVEIWDFRSKKKNAKWQKIKKPIIITLSIGILVFSLWDTVEEDKQSSNKDKIENERINIQNAKQDSLSKIDSIRLARLSNNLKTNLDKLDKTGTSILKMDSILVGVRDSLSKQVFILKSAFQKSKELVRLETIKFEIEKPNFGVFDLVFSPNKPDSTNINFRFTFINKGIRHASQIKIKHLLIGLQTNKKEVEIINKHDLLLLDSKISPQIKIQTFNEISVIGESLEELNEKSEFLIFILKYEFKENYSSKWENGQFVFKTNTIDFQKFSWQPTSGLYDQEFYKDLNDLLLNNDLDEFILDMNDLLFAE